MKKRKFNILLNIATLCLCVCAIAFGVYSAKTASLNVSGTIGFNAHNCLVNITGNYKAYTSSNLETRTKTAITETNVGGSASADYNKTLTINDTLYFSDLATDNLGHEIEFELIIKNNSPFKISVKAPAPTLTTASGTAITSVTGSTSNASFTLEQKDATNSSATIILKFTLADIESATEIANTSKFNINLSFEMWQQFTIDTVNEVLYINNVWVKTTTPKLVTTMGHSIVGTTATDAGTDGLAETPIRWYAFAVKGDKTSENTYSTKPTDIFNTTTTNITTPVTTTSTYTENGTQITETWYSLYGVDMSKVSNYKNHTYWFIQEYVVAGGYKINDSDSSSQKGILFDSTKNTYAQIDSTNESNSKKSTIYTFLEGSYATKTGITTEELNKIDSRNVDESYDVTFTGGDAKDGKLACKFSSRFWLINHAELGLLCNQSIDISDYDYKVKTYGINNQDGYTSGSTVYGAYWWLRSPYADIYDYAHYVLSDGYFSYYDVNYVYVGVRAAFQIQI